MKFRSKQLLDFYLGNFALLLLIPLAKLLGFSKLRPTELPSPPKSSVHFIKLQGGGSLVIAYPSLLGLKRAFPHLRIGLVASPSVRKFADALGLFDEIIEIDHSALATALNDGVAAWWKLLRTECIVDLEVYSRLSSVFAFITCARTKLAFFLEEISVRRHLFDFCVYFNRASPVFVFYDHVIELLGARPATSAEAKSELTKVLLLSELAPIRGKVGIAPSCSEFGKERQLSVSAWTDILSAHSIANEVLSISFLGSIEDRAFASAVIDQIRRKDPQIEIANLCGELDLRETLKVIAACETFFSIDSGLLHFARLLCQNVISFWGPTDPATRLRPLAGTRDTIQYKRLYCSPCIHVAEQPPCGGNNICMNAHTLEGPTNPQLGGANTLVGKRVRRARQPQ